MAPPKHGWNPFCSVQDPGKHVRADLLSEVQIAGEKHSQIVYEAVDCPTKTILEPRSNIWIVLHDTSRSRVSGWRWWGWRGEEKKRSSALYASWLKLMNGLTVEFEHLFSAFLSLWTWLPKISRWFALQSDSLIENSIWRSCIPKCKALPIQWNQHSTALHSTCYHLCLAQKLWQRLHQLPHLLQQILLAKAMSHPFQIMMIRMSRSTRANGPSCHPRASHHHQHLQSLVKGKTMKGQALPAEYWQRLSLWSSWYLEIIEIH